MTAQDLTLEQIAADAIQQALAGGATDAECTISEGEEFSVSVRMREVENLKEAGSRGAGIRVLTGQRSPTRRLLLHLRSLPRRHRENGESRAGASQNHQRRSLRRPARAR